MCELRVVEQKKEEIAGEDGSVCVGQAGDSQVVARDFNGCWTRSRASASLWEVEGYFVP